MSDDCVQFDRKKLVFLVRLTAYEIIISLSCIFSCN